MMQQALRQLDPDQHHEVLVLESKACYPPLAVVPVQQNPPALMQTQDHPDRHHEVLLLEYLTCHPLVTVVRVHQKSPPGVDHIYDQPVDQDGSEVVVQGYRVQHSLAWS